MKKLVLGSMVSGVFMFILAHGNWSLLIEKKLILLFMMSLITSYFQAEYNPLDFKSNKTDGGTLQQIIITIYFSSFFALFEALNYSYPHSMEMDFLSIFFLAITLLGVFFRSWAYITLGRFFTMGLKVHQGQKIVDYGPYRFFRHPSYTGALLIYFFSPLFLKAYWTAGLSLLFLLWAFVRRIKYEEKMLSINFGNDYQKFCETRFRLLPFIW